MHSPALICSLAHSSNKMHLQVVNPVSTGNSDHYEALFCTRMGGEMNKIVRFRRGITGLGDYSFFQLSEAIHHPRRTHFHFVWGMFRCCRRFPKVVLTTNSSAVWKIPCSLLALLFSFHNLFFPLESFKRPAEPSEASPSRR